MFFLFIQHPKSQLKLQQQVVCMPRFFWAGFNLTRVFRHKNCSWLSNMVHFWLTCSLSKHSTTSDNSRSEYKWCVLVWRLFVFYNHLHHSNISCDIAYVQKTLFTRREDTPGECKKFIAEIILVIKNFIGWSLQLVLMSWKTNISLSFLFFLLLLCSFILHVLLSFDLKTSFWKKIPPPFHSQHHKWQLQEQLQVVRLTKTFISSPS